MNKKFEVKFLTTAGNEFTGTFMMPSQDHVIGFIKEQELLIIDIGDGQEVIIAPENIDALVIKVVG